MDSRHGKDVAEKGGTPRLWRKRVLCLTYPLESVLGVTGGGTESMVVRRDDEIGGRDALMVEDRSRLSKVVLGMESIREGEDNTRALL